jgi:hypothetical protein
VKRAWLIAIALGEMLGACTSPEATRMRGRGSGGDVRNVGDTVLMHEGSDPYWRTPRNAGIVTPPLDSARQADRLSR